MPRLLHRSRRECRPGTSSRLTSASSNRPGRKPENDVTFPPNRMRALTAGMVSVRASETLMGKRSIIFRRIALSVTAALKTARSLLSGASSSAAISSALSPASFWVILTMRQALIHCTSIRRVILR